MLNIIVETMANLIKRKTQVKVKTYNQTLDECPRCGNEWIFQGFDHRCKSDNCIRATDSLGISYEILYLRLKNHQIEWYSKHCLVIYLEAGKNSIEVAHLPFDITEDQLQLYLTFA